MNVKVYRELTDNSRPPVSVECDSISILNGHLICYRDGQGDIVKDEVAAFAPGSWSHAISPIREEG